MSLALQHITMNCFIYTLKLSKWKKKSEFVNTCSHCEIIEFMLLFIVLSFKILDEIFVKEEKYTNACLLKRDFCFNFKYSQFCASIKLWQEILHFIRGRHFLVIALENALFELFVLFDIFFVFILPKYQLAFLRCYECVLQEEDCEIM